MWKKRLVIEVREVKTAAERERKKDERGEFITAEQFGHNSCGKADVGTATGLLVDSGHRRIATRENQSNG